MFINLTGFFLVKVFRLSDNSTQAASAAGEKQCQGIGVRGRGGTILFYFQLVEVNMTLLSRW